MISRTFIERPILATVVSILIVLVGVISIPVLPVEKTPDITPPTVIVSAFYPGANAQTIAETVATPLEEQINGVDGMLYMASTSSDDGSMTITVTFEVGTNVDMATVLVQNRVAMAEPLLPEEVKRQGVITQKQSTSMSQAIALVSPNGTYDDVYLSNYINIRLKDSLSRVEGVGSIMVFGAKDFGMRIWLNPDKLKARNLTTQEVLQTIREQNVQVAAGKIGASPSPADQQFQYTVRTMGRLKESGQFEDIVVKIGPKGQIVRLKDIAKIELDSQSYNSYCNFNGSPSVAMGI